jgi:hypothetical protein
MIHDLQAPEDRVRRDLCELFAGLGGKIPMRTGS